MSADMSSRRTPDPLAADYGSANPRKTKGYGDDRGRNRETEKHRRAPGQADVYSKTAESNHSRLKTKGVPDSRGAGPSQPPTIPPAPRNASPSQPTTQVQSKGSSGNDPKNASCKDFYVRGFTRRQGERVNVAAAKAILHDLKQPRCLDDLFAIDYNATFKAARTVIDSFYHSITCFEGRAFQRDTCAGTDTVGRIGLFFLPVLRGDPRPLNPDDNHYLLPGLHDTNILVKITPALIYNNDHHEHMNIKTLTTKHNTNPQTLQKSGVLKRDFVLMHRTSKNDDKNEGTHASEPQCFASLNFVATSESFEYKDSCFMLITESQTYPRRAPWMDLGYLADREDHVTLDKILQVASTRLAAPNLKKIAKLARSAQSTLPSNPTRESIPPKDWVKSTGVPAQTQETDTIISKVCLLLQLTSLFNANVI
jgi:hypothetical protein